jgi:hypothetical protein
MARALSKKLGAEAGSQPFEVLHLLVCAIGRLTEWPLEIGLQGHWKMIELRMGAGVVAAIEDATGLSLPKVTDLECLIAQLPVAAQ